MRAALDCSKDATTPEAQLSLQGNKRAQNEANGWNPKSSGVRVGIALDGGRNGPAVLNADALNDPAVGFADVGYRLA